MELTHNTRRFLKTAAPVIGSAGMLFAVYRWMVNRRGKAVEEQTSVRHKSRGFLKTCGGTMTYIIAFIRFVMIIWKIIV